MSPSSIPSRSDSRSDSTSTQAMVVDLPAQSAPHTGAYLQADFKLDPVTENKKVASKFKALWKKTRGAKATPRVTQISGSAKSDTRVPFARKAVAATPTTAKGFKLRILALKTSATVTARQEVKAAAGSASLGAEPMGALTSEFAIKSDSNSSSDKSTGVYATMTTPFADDSDDDDDDKHAAAAFPIKHEIYSPYLRAAIAGLDLPAAHQAQAITTRSPSPSPSAQSTLVIRQVASHVIVIQQADQATAAAPRCAQVIRSDSFPPRPSSLHPYAAVPAPASSVAAATPSKPVDATLNGAASTAGSGRRLGHTYAGAVVFACWPAPSRRASCLGQGLVVTDEPEIAPVPFITVDGCAKAEVESNFAVDWVEDENLLSPSFSPSFSPISSTSSLSLSPPPSPLLSTALPAWSSPAEAGERDDARAAARVEAARVAEAKRARAALRRAFEQEYVPGSSLASRKIGADLEGVVAERREASRRGQFQAEKADSEEAVEGAMRALQREIDEDLPIHV